MRMPPQTDPLPEESALTCFRLRLRQRLTLQIGRTAESIQPMSHSNQSGLRKIRRALISVSDKTGIVEFVRELETFGVEIISTGGTAKTLREAGIEVIEVSS